MSISFIHKIIFLLLVSKSFRTRNFNAKGEFHKLITKKFYSSGMTDPLQTSREALKKWVKRYIYTRSKVITVTGPLQDGKRECLKLDAGSNFIISILFVLQQRYYALLAEDGVLCYLLEPRIKRKALLMILTPFIIMTNEENLKIYRSRELLVFMKIGRRFV